MESVLKKIRERAEEYDKQLLATDPRFRRSVTLSHEDGSHFYFEEAFLMRVEWEWIVCFTGHHGVHVYHSDDLSAFHEMEVRAPSTIEALP